MITDSLFSISIASRCTAGVLGILMDSTTDEGGCQIDESTGLPTDTCRFIPLQQATSAASIMYAEYLNSVRVYIYIVVEVIS